MQNKQVDIGRTRKVEGFRIHVTGSRYPAIVDENKFHDVSRMSWHLSSTGYAKTNLVVNGKPKTAWLHEFVYGQKSDCDVVLIFLNGDKLDCRVENIAEADRQIAGGMAKVSKVNTSGFKGVCWSKVCKKWIATIGAGKRKRHLGVFIDKISAAISYDAAALKYYGPDAMTNKKMGLY